MPRQLALAVLALALALLNLACNGDGPTAPGTPTTPQPFTPPAARTPHAEPSPPSPVTESPPVSETPAPGESPTATPIPRRQATPAIRISDPSQYIQGGPIQEECFFDPRSAIADCGQRGIYSPEPAPVGQDISCSVFIAEAKPVVLLCLSQEPQEAVYYAIQQP